MALAFALDDAVPPLAAAPRQSALWLARLALTDFRNYSRGELAADRRPVVLTDVAPPMFDHLDGLAGDSFLVGGVFSIAEAGWSGGDRLRSSLKAGGFHHSGEFVEFSSGAVRHGLSGGYVAGEQTLLRDLSAIGGCKEGGVEVFVNYTRRAPVGWPHPPGRLDAAKLRAHGWPPDARALVHVCGPTGFVEAAADYLVAYGYDSGRIRTERFGPTGD